MLLRAIAAIAIGVGVFLIVTLVALLIGLIKTPPTQPKEASKKS